MPDLSVYALKDDIPELTNLSNYALKSEIPQDRMKMAVVAFDLSKCPDDWTEYEKAHGRFIRGIDRGEPKIDPDGERQPGGLQSDELKSHTHTRDMPEPYSGGRGNSNRTKYQTNKEIESNPTGGLETRPKNVALLYCFRYQ